MVAFFLIFFLALGAILNGAALYVIAAVGFGFTTSIGWFLLAGAVATVTLNKWVAQVLWATSVLLVLWYLIGGPVPIYQSFGG